jgi:VCBS repeat-containing protein
MRCALRLVVEEGKEFHVTTTYTGTSGNDVIDGGNGADRIFGGDGDDIIYGGNGGDTLDGGTGNDTLYGQNGSDNLYGGEGDDLIDGNLGFDVVYYSGLIQEYTFLATAGFLHIIHQGGAGLDGHDRVTEVERLVFADRIIDIGSGHNRPVAGDDYVNITEDTGTYSSGTASVLDNDFDFDGDAMTVTSGVFTGTYGTLTLNSNGTYTYTVSASAQALAEGDAVQDSFNYTVTDNDGSDIGALVFNIFGLNDAPTANPDTGSTGENAILSIDVLANDTDPDNGAFLTVTDASAPAGKGSASTDGTQVQFDPGTDFDHLALGASEVVVISYSISDEHNATSSSTVSITVTGTNDGPVANADTAAGTENQMVTIDALANDTDVDDGAVKTLAAVSAPAGKGSASIVGNQIQFNPGTAFDHLAQGATEVVVLSYTMQDEHGATSSSTVSITVTGTNDGPVANADTAAGTENQVLTINALANDTDVDDGAVKTLVAVSAPAGKGSASIVGNQVQFNPGTAFDHLAQGATEVVVLNYTMQDQFGATSSSTITLTITGTNDGPVANPDTAATGEDTTILINALANDTDVDDGAVLTVTAASAPAGHGTASVVGNQVQFDPSDALAEGEIEVVVVGYTIKDEHGASASSTVTITVTGANDGPVANPDSRTTSESSAVVINVLGNDVDVDHDAVLTVTAATGPAGQGSVTIVENQVRFDPGGDFDYLAAGESAVVVINYTIEDEYGVSSSSTATVTVQGREAGSQFTGTDDGETLTGTPGDDTLDALGGDDNVFGLAGDDIIHGGEGNDSLDGEEDNDVVEGGNGDDLLSGGEGDDQLLGEAGSDSAFGGNGADQLSGGAGFDQLFGDAGDDVIEGGNDDDLLSGGDDDDDLSGEAGNDSLSGDSGDDALTGGIGNDNLDGGEGDDDLDGGDGNDFMADLAGTNSFVGGIGDDTIIAGSADGAQTIDAGDGNDTIRHYYRDFASTITTGTGSDTIEIAHADQGTAAIVVTDFTAGAGGDKFRLSGDDGALLSLLSGWDGSSNPFGSSGFLRLQQSGTDTVLQWDQDGTAGGANWETLVVFQNTDVDDFTDANFVPGYDPDGTPPAGETITGTNDSDILIGTVGSDTINALAGDDVVNGNAGADQISAGDGFDQVHGDADDDVIDGGNDDDYLWGGNGNDQLLGQAGFDNLFGEDGDDVLSGGADNDNLDGGEGDDDLDGGDGDDFLSDTAGTNSFVGGLGNDTIIASSADGAQTINGGDGNDTIRHYYRSSASTITTGTGSDTIEIAHADIGTAAIVVTDFTPGTGGDMFRLTGDDGALLSLLSGWDGSSNPFGSSGFLRLQQSGTDTVLQWDQDGTAGGANWETLVVFQNTDVDDFTDANFVPGYDPDGSAPGGETITGTEGDDVIAGTVGADTINALGGNDVVNGNAGADQISAGDGFDQVHGDADDDVIDGGNDDDYLWGDEGNDQLLGQAGFDNLFGEEGDDNLSGGADNDNLDGGEGADTLLGGDGQDFLIGGLGSDVLTGGADADSFYYQLASHGGDQITDLVSGTDKIYISAGGFGGGLFVGATVSLVSGSNPTASGASGQFLYDTDDGSLFWDADGAGAGNAVLVATFSNLPSLQTSDFVVVF